MRAIIPSPKRRVLAAALLSLLPVTAAQALHIDVAVSVVNGRLSTDFCLPGSDGCDRLAVLDALGFSGTTLPIDQLSGQQIFVSDFGDLDGGPFRVDDPGFISGPGTLPAGQLLRYRAVGALEFWDPAVGSWGSSVPGNARIRLAGGLSEAPIISTDPADCGSLPFCTVPGFEESSTLFTAGGIGGEAMLVIDRTDASGQLHTHLDFQIEGPTGVLGGAAGAYLIELLLSADGLQDSTPFYFMFNRGLSTTAFADALAARILLEELDPSSVAGGISGTVVFGADGSNAELTVPLTGTGTLIKRGGGLLVLSGSNSYSGTTTIESGVLRGEVTSSGRLNVASAALFETVTSRFGSLSGEGMVDVDTLLEVGGDSTSTRFSGLVTGTGRLMKSGFGMLEVTGALANTGGVDVMGGTLQVNGSVAGPVELHSGSRLGGTGTLAGSLSVNAGATVAPGNSIGTMNVATATFDPGSVLEVEVDAAGNADRIVATGAVTVNGGSVSVLAAPGAYASATRYTLIEAAGGVTGVFDGVSSNLVFLEPSLAYDANRVFLDLVRRAQGFVLDGQSANQNAVAAWLSEAQDSPALAPLVTDLLGSSAAQANATFDALGGIGHTATARSLLSAGQSLGQAFLRRAGSGLESLEGGGLSAGSRFDRGVEVWIDTLASGVVYDDAGATRGFTQSADGVALGVAMVTRAGTRLGVGASALRLSTNQNGLDEEIDGVMPSLALYAGSSEGRMDWRLALGAGRAWLESTRRIRGAELVAEPTVWQAFLAGEAGWRLAGPVGAYARVSASRTDSLDISESGAGDIALSAEVDGLYSLAPELGLRLAHAFDSIVVDARAGWQHETGDRATTLEGRLTGSAIPSTFRVSGIEMEPDAAVLGLSIASRPDAEEGLQLSLQADARLRGAGQSEYAASAGLRYRW